jgi:hypothetical protein
MVKLIPEWKSVLLKAWSVRLMAFMAILSAAELSLPLFRDTMGPASFAFLTFGVAAVAIFVRVLRQGNMDAGDEQRPGR